jgi:hypothetical protein
VPASETLRGVHVVAAPDALDAAVVPAGALALRFAPDELFVTGAGPVTVTDPYAIVVDEVGFSAATFSWDDYERAVAPRHEWPLPAKRPALAQGVIAAVPAKLWITRDAVTVIFPTAYADELMGRLR